MNRLKLLGAVALLGVLACEEATPPPPVGSIAGQVAIEGTGIDGVSVSLSNGNSTTTTGGGSYRFDNVEGGAYTVTISGYPSDATFDATSAAATISSAGQSVTVNFSGSYIRTASVMGTVTVENVGLGGVTVALSGVSSATAVTDDSGQYAFTGLRAGSYSVEISGFDSDEIGFSNTAAAVTVDVGESKIRSFDGTYLRTASIQGQVSVEGEGLEGVTVSLSGGPDGVNETTMTDASGQYSFARLRAGGYQVGISGYDTDNYEFDVTSQSVTVALGDVAPVSFEGVLLRTSGISGRVSVEGMGLEDIAVTLSMADAEDMTAMTDAGGLYAFAGLAAGAYTVSIAVESDAYVFDEMSKDVMVGEDSTAIVNFDGEHARTASVTVRLFIDELLKNDTHDEGEMPFPTPEMLALVGQLGLPLQLPVSLAGPGVLDMQQGTAMPDGSVVFANLKAGNYQVIVTDIPAEVLAALPPALGAVLRDYAYGGPAAGYDITLGVGEQAMQAAPIDITHTTVHFGVTLKGGEIRGMPIPGATVTLYEDATGGAMVDEGMGMTMVDEATGLAAASIRFARAGTTGNTVHASVDAGDAYTVDPEAGRQAVMWDPQQTYTIAANDANILNLNVDVSFGGATATTMYGGGDALAGWVIGVMSGDDPTDLMAVEGDDVPTMLDEDGMAAFKRTVMPTDLPATYHFGVAPDQPNALDGGEKYEGTPVSHTHTGLSLAGTVDAGMIEVQFTTQTLKVYVHNERDQVQGYTGNIIGGDVRSSAGIDVGIRYIDDSGRSRAFPSSAKISTPRNNGDMGVWSFSNVPADAKVIVQAEKAAGAGNIMLLDPDELAAYTDMDTNGITGGAFGDEGGFSHTVELCPLMATDPTGQDHGECGSFAWVNTYSVSGLVWKRQVVANAANANDDSFTVRDPVFVPGISVALDPVEGKNLAGDAESATTTEKPVRTAGENSAGTSILDETHQFDFGQMAAGVYKISVSDGWRYRMGGKGATALLGGSLNPLASDLAIDVTPATTTVYGYVRGVDTFPLAEVLVKVNNAEATTDVHGRYIAEGVVPETRRIGNTTHRNMIFVETAETGSEATREIISFAANSPIRQDIELTGVGKTASISGTVTASGSGDPVAGAEILVDGAAPANKATRGVNAGKLVTGADGTYTAIIAAKALGQTARVTVSKAGMSFVPAALDAPAHAGAEISGIDFAGFLHATIRGRVKNPAGNAMGGVTITATGAGGAGDNVSSTSNARGTFVLSVPFGTYTIAASAVGYTFSYPNNNQTVSVAPGQELDFGDIQAAAATATLASLSIPGVNITPSPFNANTLAYTASVSHATTSIDVNAAGAAGVEVTISYMHEDASAPTPAVNGRVNLDVGVTTVSIEASFPAAAAAATGSATSTTSGTTAAATESTTYTIAVTRAPSADAMLSSLSLSGVTLTPAFDGAVTTYTASVGYTTSETTVEAEASSGAASVGIDPDDADGDAENGHQVALAVGANEITVTVTAGNGSQQDYTVTVTRDAAPSSDATLSALSLSGVTLEPAFDGAVTAYTASVGNDVATTTVEATPNDGAASADIDPADADMITMGHQVNLDVGDNTITVTVTAEDGSTQDYTVAVTRAASSDASLSALELSGVTLNPAFASDVNGYTATVGYTTGSTTVDATANSGEASVAIVPADADADAAGHQVNLRVGVTDITVRVTAEDGTEMDYTVAVTRDGAPSADAALSALSLSGVTLEPDFSPSALNYTASVGNDVAQTTVTATQRHSAATVAIMPADDDAATDGHQVDLDVGDNDIMVRVTAEDGTEQTYSVTVTRAQSSDATLGSLSLSDVTLDPAFDPATTAYAASVEYEVMSTTVDAEANSGEASVIVVPDDADANTAGHQVGLDVGDNAITVSVTAEDGSRMDYTVTVTRMAQSSDASLAMFMVGDDEVMADADGNYAHSVGYDVMQVTVSATAGHADASAAITSPDDADGETDGHQVDLGVGDTEVMATVTAEDGTTQTYTLTINRAASSDASLAMFMVGDDEVMADADGNYAHSVGYDVMQVTVSAMAGHEDALAAITSPDDADGETDGHQVDLGVGDTEVMATVTAGDGTEMTYTLTVTRAASSDVSLSSVRVGDDEVMAGDDGTYSHDVGNDVAMATIAATATHADATVTISGDDADADAEGHQAALAVGANTITITVTAGDGMTADYMLTVNRAAAPGIMISSTDLDDDGKPTISLGEGESADYMVSLATMPTADVAVTITTPGGLSVDRGTLNFPREAWNVQQGVKITAAEDADFADGEDLNVAHVAGSSDTDYQSDPDDAATGLSQTVTVDVADDDVEAREVNVITGTADAPVTTTSGNSVALSIAEKDAGTFGVSLGAETGDAATGKPLGNVTVTITVPDDAAFSLSTKELTFTPDNFRMPQTVTVTPVRDAIQTQTPGSEAAVALTLTAEGGGYNDTGVADDDEDDTNNAGYIAALAAVTVNVTITEDDIAGTTVSATGLQIFEGETGTYSIKLNSDPGGTVVITATSSHAAATVQPTELFFNSNNWETEQTVTVSAVGNTTANGNVTGITIANAVTTAQAGNGYSTSTTVADVGVTVVDDETLQLVVTPTALSIVQGGEGSYEVRLTGAPADGETVTVTVAPGTGLSGATVLTFTAADGAGAAQTVTIGVLATTPPTGDGGTAINVVNTLTTTVDDGTSYNTSGITTTGTVAVTVTAPPS